MKKYRVTIKAEVFDHICILASDEEGAEIKALEEYKKRFDKGFYGYCDPMILTIEHMLDK